MRNPLRALVTWLTVAALLVSSPAWARQHVVDSALLQQAIGEQRAMDEANRQLIERVLRRPDVQAVAARMGLDIKDARSAIAGVSGEELAAIARTADAVDVAGGQGPTVTISLVVLLLVIIIVILLAD